MYGAIIDKLMKASDDPQYYTKDGITFVDCYMVGGFSDMQFMINDHWINITPYDYIWDVNGDAETCIVMITEHDYDFFVLGLPIFQGFYTHHSVTDSTISWTPLKGLNRPPLEYGAVPADYLFPRPVREDSCTVLCVERGFVSWVLNTVIDVVIALPKFIINFTTFTVKMLIQTAIFLVEFAIFLIKLPFLIVYYFFYGIYYIFVVHKW
jgi:hypothetical protein